ncbi:MAG: transporter, family, nitrate/nitrite transporter [Pseudonocardiales bacterium]|nr:transporter, family, nitrate/nitrite transporter [Pseudonocardiales bacterium]
MAVLSTEPLSVRHTPRPAWRIRVRDDGFLVQLLDLGADQPARCGLPRRAGPQRLPAGLPRRGPGGRRVGRADPCRCADRPVREPGDVPGSERPDDRPGAVRRVHRRHVPAADRWRVLARDRRDRLRRGRAAGQRLVPAATPRACVGVFGIGMGGTAVSAFATVRLADAYGRAAPFVIVAVVLALYAAISAVALRDAPGRVPATGSFLARTWETVRLPAVWQLSLLYAVSFGGFVAFSVYLPPISATPTSWRRRTRPPAPPASWSSRC